MTTWSWRLCLSSSPSRPGLNFRMGGWFDFEVILLQMFQLYGFIVVFWCFLYGFCYPFVSISAIFSCEYWTSKPASWQEMKPPPFWAASCSLFQVSEASWNCNITTTGIKMTSGNRSMYWHDDFCQGQADPCIWQQALFCILLSYNGSRARNKPLQQIESMDGNRNVSCEKGGLCPVPGGILPQYGPFLTKKQ